MIKVWSILFQELYSATEPYDQEYYDVAWSILFLELYSAPNDQEY